MNQKKIRIPQQKRSIEKKKRILEAAQRLYYKNGYMSTGVNEIAAEAELSTGSVYAYFRDKKDILITWIAGYNSVIESRISENVAKMPVERKGDIRGRIESAARQVIGLLVSLHDFPKVFHDELAALRYMDKGIARLFSESQRVMIKMISEQFETLGISFERKKEKALLLYSIFETVEDNLVFSADPGIDRDALVGEYVKVIVSMLD